MFQTTLEQLQASLCSFSISVGAILLFSNYWQLSPSQSFEQLYLVEWKYLFPFSVESLTIKTANFHRFEVRKFANEFHAHEIDNSA